MVAPHFKSLLGIVEIASGSEVIGQVEIAPGSEIIGSVHISQDLKVGAQSIALTVSSGSVVASVPIPSTATVVGVKPVSSTAIRVGLEAPETDGAATGTAVAANLKKGVPVDAAVWTWFSLGGAGAGRILYVKGNTNDVVEVVVM